MNKLENLEVDKIAQSCINLFNNLPKTGKPTVKEWTVLSCLVKYDAKSKVYEVVSLGTGSKCIGASKMSSKGEILNDSHAEVMARRGFLLYLYDQMNRCLDGTGSIFAIQDNKFKLRTGLYFIFYSSQLPCGDASIIPKDGDKEHFGDLLKSQKRPADDELCDIESKMLKHEDEKRDIYRTGAKCLPDVEQDPKLPGMNYHLCGQVRTKPGRGDKTLSVSCSDKMARWVHCGIQGSLLDMLLCNPIYISSFVFGAGAQFSEDSLKRAFLQRNTEKLCGFVVPDFYQSNVEFPYIKKDDNMRPVASSIVWSKTDIKYVNLTMLLLGSFLKGCLNFLLFFSTIEVAVKGIKLGVTKKNLNTSNSALKISKFNLYKKFSEILNKNVKLKTEIVQDKCFETIPYNEMKSRSVRYRNQWSNVKNSFFKTWTVKPDMWTFSVDSWK